MYRKAIFTDLAPAQVCHTPGNAQDLHWVGGEFNSWSEYWKNIKLISDFEDKYGFE